MKMILKAIMCCAFLVSILSAVGNAQDDALVKEPVTYNIEGIFSCDWNGKYYVRQIGNEVLWFGEDDNVTPNWSNVAHGTINGNMINIIWGDVPKGSVMQHGTLVIKINSNDNFEKLSQEGDFFGSTIWTRYSP